MRVSLVIGLLFAASGCAGRQRGPGEASARWVLVTVESARIREAPDSAASWDVDASSAQSEQRERNGRALGTLLGFSAGVGAGEIVSGLAALSSEPHEEATAALPDPVLEMAFHEDGETTRRTSVVAYDSVEPAWGYSAYVDLDAVDDEGLDVDVLDFDTRASSRIGGARLSRDELEAVAAGSEREVTRSDGALESLRIRISPVVDAATPSAWTHHVLPLRDGLRPTGVRVAVHALVTVKLRGSGRVGGPGAACTGRVGPAGLAGGGCRDENLSHGSMRTAPHGSAVALVGADEAVSAVSLAPTAGETCVQFLAPASGEVVLGVNDRHFEDDSGSFEMDLLVGPPPEDTARLDRGGGPAACATDAH